MLDRRKKLQVKIAAELLDRSEALQSVIPFASEIEKMGEIQKPVVTSKPKGKGALASVVCMRNWYHFCVNVHRVSILIRRSNIDEQVDWDPDLWWRYPWVEFSHTSGRKDVAT